MSGRIWGRKVRQLCDPLWAVIVGVGSAYVGEGRRMGGGDSPDGQRFRDSFSSAQHNLIERALASNDSRNLVSDE